MKYVDESCKSFFIKLIVETNVRRNWFTIP